MMEVFFCWKGWFATPAERLSGHNTDSQCSTAQHLVKHCAVQYCAASNEALCSAVAFSI